MTAREWLDAVEALADAATKGPWYVFSDDQSADDAGVWPYVEAQDGTRPTESQDCEWANPEFIAAARTAVPALVAALRAVLDRCDGNEGQSRDVDDLIDDLRAAIDAHVPGGAS